MSVKEAVVRSAPPTGQVGEELFAYRYADGGIAFYVERPAGNGDHDRPLLWGPTADGARWQDNLKNVPRPLPLYREGTLFKHPDIPVVFHRSERDAYRAATGGLHGVHTTSVMGAGYARASDFSVLSGRKVVICQDSNPEGIGYAEEVAALAFSAGAATVEVVRLPGLPEGSGVGGWLEEGGTGMEWRALLDRRLGNRLNAAQIADQALSLSLEDLQDEDEEPAPPVAEPAVARARTKAPEPAPVETGTAMPVTLSDLSEDTPEPAAPGLRRMVAEVMEATFGEPSPLPLKGTPELAFDPNLLPGPVQDFALDVAERFGCPPEVPAVALTVALGAVIGRRMAIAPKRQDERPLTVNLWAALVTQRPVSGGVHAVDEALLPLEQLELAAHREFENAEREHQKRVQALQAARSAWMEEVRTAQEQGANVDALLARHPADPEPPRLRRYRTATGHVPALAEMADATPGGLLLTRDDLSAWVHGLAAPGHEGERHFFMSMAEGTAPHVEFDLPTGVPLRCSNPSLSLLAWARSAPLRRTASDGTPDPLLGHVQMLIGANGIDALKEADHEANVPARGRVERVFQALDRLPSVPAGAAMPTLHFDAEAQSLYDSWRGDHAVQLAAETDPAVAAHLAGHDRLMPAVAMIFHLAELAEQGRDPVPVSASATHRAVRWCDWAAAHVRAVYGVGEAAELEGARTLLKRLLDGDLTTPFKVREVYRRHWTGLGTREAAQAAVGVLERHGYLSSVPVPTTAKGGKPTRAYHLNPKALKAVEARG